MKPNDQKLKKKKNLSKKAGRAKKAAKKEARGKGWHPLVLLVASLLAGAWMLFG